jgi:peptide/nickel transport system ATP-binding protein
MLLQINNLSLSLITDNGTFDALKEISIWVDEKQCAAVVGESGSGKTLTSLAVMGLLPKQAVKSITGEIIFNSPTQGKINLLTLTEKEWRNIRGGEIAMIFQEPMTALNPVYTCGKQLRENITVHQKISTKQAKQKAFDLLDEVKLREPERILSSYPHQLSGGQRQRVMIAMALAQNPALLIADEPTTALDVTVQASIIELLKELQQKRGLGILFISHDLGLVKNIAQTATVMYKGRVMENNTVANIFTSPQNIYTKALLQCSVASNPNVYVLPTLKDFFDETPDGLVEKPYQPFAENTLKKERSTQKAITINNLFVEYGNDGGFSLRKKAGKKVLNDVSVDIYTGETLAVVGESGSGKTTLGMTILQTTSITGGSIDYNGKTYQLNKLKGRREFRKHFQLVFQDPYSSLNPRISIGEQIEEAVKNFDTKINTRQRTNELLAMVGLDATAYNKYPHEFSGGQRQRICIARALAPNPKFLVLDEAVSALDVSVQAQVLNLLKKLQTELGLTYFFITHDLNVARFIADRILVIQNGQVVELQEKEELFNSPQSDYTKQLLKAGLGH